LVRFLNNIIKTILVNYYFKIFFRGIFKALFWLYFKNPRPDSERIFITILDTFLILLQR
jgi:hypothetical protein